MIDGIHSRCSTNIIAGLKDAFDVMEHRKHFNDLTCVMLLSDGQDTCGNRQEDFAPFLKE